MDLSGWVTSIVSEGAKILSREPRVETVTVSKVKEVVSEMTPKTLVAGSQFVRLAGLSGGLAVALSGYGAHGNDLKLSVLIT